MKRSILVLLAALVATVSVAADARRFKDVELVLSEMAKAGDAGIPASLLLKAQCVVVVPSLKKVAFIGGGQFGRGYMSCRRGNGWSAPAGLRIEGGSVGFQIGGSATDVILIVMNDRGIEKLLSNQFTVGGDANAAAGPVGRHVAAETDITMRAEMLSWSRSRGAFAGISLQGATLRDDVDENTALYGRPISNREIVTSDLPVPKDAEPFLKMLSLFSKS